MDKGEARAVLNEYLETYLGHSLRAHFESPAVPVPLLLNLDDKGRRKNLAAVFELRPTLVDPRNGERRVEAHPRSGVRAGLSVMPVVMSCLPVHGMAVEVALAG